MGEVPFEILARGPWPEGRVSVREAAPFQVASAHEPLVESAWRAAEEEARASGRRLFPGPVAGLTSFVAATDLALVLHRTDYRAFVGTNLSAAYRALGARRADALGISIVIELAGRTILLHRRGAGCFEWPLAIDTPGGHVEPDRHGFSPFAAALDELESELGILAAEVTARRILGLARVKETGKPQAVVWVRVAPSFEEIRSRLEHARERFETSELLTVPVADLAGLAWSGESVTPAGRAALVIGCDGNRE